MDCEQRAVAAGGGVQSTVKYRGEVVLADVEMEKTRRV